MLTRQNLHGYQERALSVLLNQKKAYLSLSMGLGKTVSALTAIVDISIVEPIRVLVIAPKRVAESVWIDEVSKWEHLQGLTVSLIAGTAQQRALAASSDAIVHVISRDNVQWLVEALGDRWTYDTLIIDEGDSFKNPASKRFKMLKRVRGLCNRAWILSGTPAPNGLLDVWAQYFLIDGGERLGKTLTAYKSRFFDADYQGWSFKLKAGAETEIYKRIADITVSMRAEDYLTLPERIDNVIRVTLPPAVRALYEKMEKDFILEIADTEITAVNAAVLAGKLMQLANGAVYDENRTPVFIHDEKLDALGDVIAGANGFPVMVLYSFKHDLIRIKTRWPNARELKTTKDIDDWNAGKVPLLLAHPASCGHGLNLQSATGSSQCWFGLPWSLGLYQQACARIHRQGVKHAVVIHHLITADSIDELVMNTLTTKGAGQERLLAALRHKYLEPEHV